MDGMNKNTQMQEIDFLLVGQDQETLLRDAGVLREAGHQHVVIAHAGLEARNVLRTSRVHFVITELRMFCMSGLELLKLIRRTPGLSEIPVLLTSGNRQKEMILHAIDEMVDGYLAKPYSGEDLLHAVNAVLKRKTMSPPKSRIRQARHHLLLKEYARAIELAKEVLYHDKNNSDAFFLLSECYYWLQESDKARHFLQMYLKEKPGSGKGMHLLSKVCRLHGECGDAFGVLVKAHRENPLNIDLTIDLGKFYLEMNMEEKAQDLFNQVMASEPTDLNLIKIGKAFLKKGSLADAALYLDKTVQPLPETAYVFARFAQLLEKNGDYAASARQYEKCLGLMPGHGEYLVRLGEVLLKQGERDRAKAVLAQCPQDDPAHAQAAGLLQLAARQGA
jgi:CheY-like chemotaxis protein/cytochrome c-type biogenesis protein CcmH/NrfG